MSSKRKQFGLKDMIKILERHAHCAMCNDKLLQGYHKDHIQALGRDGPDIQENIQLLCHECHRVKTSGTPSTTLGSDIYEIAKTRRLTDDQEAFRRRLLARETGQPRPTTGKWPNRKFSSHRRGKPDGPTGED